MQEDNRINWIRKPEKGVGEQAVFFCFFGGKSFLTVMRTYSFFFDGVWKVIRCVWNFVNSIIFKKRKKS